MVEENSRIENKPSWKQWIFDNNLDFVNPPTRKYIKSSFRWKPHEHWAQHHHLRLITKAVKCHKINSILQTNLSVKNKFTCILILLMFEPQHTASESLIRLETNTRLWITCRHSYSLSSKMISKLDKI